MTNITSPSPPTFFRCNRTEVLIKMFSMTTVTLIHYLEDFAIVASNWLHSLCRALCGRFLECISVRDDTGSESYDISSLAQ